MLITPTMNIISNVTIYFSSQNGTKKTFLIKKNIKKIIYYCGFNKLKY